MLTTWAGRSPDELFLSSSGILTRPVAKRSNSTGSFVQSLVDVYLDNEHSEPGLWALSEGRDALFIRRPEYAADAGMQAHTNRAIPLPDGDVPLEALLEFKAKRLPELHALNVTLDEMCQCVLSAENTHAELDAVIVDLDQKYVDIIKVSRESD